MTPAATSARRALIVDDEGLIRWSIRQRLEENGLDVLEARTGEEAITLFGESPDVVVLDYRLPDFDGFEVLTRMRSTRPGVPVIMLTAHASVDQAVQAMKSGAFHYAGKPFDLDELSLLISRALEDSSQRLPGGREAEKGEGVSAIVGDSEPMRRAKRLLAKVARSPASTVLVCGETGVGKDLAARAIHHDSERAEAPFMNITCSAMPTTLLESELFGHEKGAFTDAKQRKVGLLERADGGTVFLDEVAETEPSFQAKLLRFVEERTFRRVGGSDEIRPDVRIIAATNVDFADAMADGRFREDLYHRLAVIRIDLPPLRERGGDVEVLAEHFVARFAKQFDKSVRLTREARRALSSYPWPGNVRELRNSIERAVLLCDGEELELDDLGTVGHARIEHVFTLPPDGVDLADVERSLLVQALERTDGNQTRAAQLLGLKRDQVRYRMQKFGIARPIDDDEE